MRVNQSCEGANGAGSPEVHAALPEVDAAAEVVRSAGCGFFKILDAFGLLEEFGIPGHPADEAKPPLHIECALTGEPTWGHHKHSCNCGTTWEHADSLPRLTTHDEFELAHTCPKCMTGKIFDKVWP